MRHQADRCHHQSRCGNQVHDRQRLDAANAVGQHAAHRTHQRAGKHAARRQVARGNWRKAILAVEVDRQRRSQPREAAKGHAIEEHEPPRVLVLQYMQVFGDRLRWWCGRRVLRHRHVNKEGDRQRDQAQAKHILPAESHRQRRRTTPDRGSWPARGMN